MAAAQGLKATHGVDDRVKGVDDKLHVVINGAQFVFKQPTAPSLVTILPGVEKMREETQQVANDMGDQKRSLFISLTQLAMND